MSTRRRALPPSSEAGGASGRGSAAGEIRAWNMTAKKTGREAAPRLLPAAQLLSGLRTGAMARWLSRDGGPNGVAQRPEPTASESLLLQPHDSQSDPGVSCYILLQSLHKKGGKCDKANASNGERQCKLLAHSRYGPSPS